MPSNVYLPGTRHWRVCYVAFLLPPLKKIIEHAGRRAEIALLEQALV